MFATRFLVGLALIAKDARPSEQETAFIAACSDQARLEKWLHRAAAAQGAPSIFDETDRTDLERFNMRR